MKTTELTFIEQRNGFIGLFDLADNRFLYLNLTTKQAQLFADCLQTPLEVRRHAKHQEGVITAWQKCLKHSTDEARRQAVQINRDQRFWSFDRSTEPSHLLEQGEPQEAAPQVPKWFDRLTTWLIILSAAVAFWLWLESGFAPYLLWGVLVAAFLGGVRYFAETWTEFGGEW